MNTELREKVFVMNVKNYILENERAVEKEDKMNNMENLMDYIGDNKDLFDLDKYKDLKTAIFNKLIEIKGDWPDAVNCLDIWFPDYNRKDDLPKLVPVEATVKRIEWITSKNSCIKPSVILEPVKINEITISKVTGNNANYIVTNKIGTGTVLKIVISGFVIPKIVEVISGQVDKPELPNRKYVWDGDDIIAIEPVPYDIYKDYNKKSCNVDDELYSNTIPIEVNDDWFDVEPICSKNSHLIGITKSIGVNTVGSSLRNGPREEDLKGNISCPKFVVSPWLNSSIEPDTNLKPIISLNDDKVTDTNSQQKVFVSSWSTSSIEPDTNTQQNNNKITVSTDLPYSDTSQYFKSSVEPDTNKNNDEGYEIKKCRIRSERLPIVGDKFCSSNANLGTIGSQLNVDDMPFIICSSNANLGIIGSQLNTNDMPFIEGITSDIVINLNNVPSDLPKLELPKLETSEEIKESTTLIFEDYTTTVFTVSNHDLNFTDSIIECICNKYNITDKNSVLNNALSLDKIKADTTFPNGKFIMKLNDNSYELYDKQTNITTARFYGVYTNVVINKLGKFGKVSI